MSKRGVDRVRAAS